jgi:hypothetical protein
MRTKFVLTAVVLFALSSQACVSVLSHSYSNPSTEHPPFVSESDWDYGVLHLSHPAVENVVLKLERKIATPCARGPLLNVQTTLTLRDFLFFQVYSVRLTAECVGAQGGSVAGVS